MSRKNRKNERLLHAAVRSIQHARDAHDPRRRLHWNRITLVVLPVVPISPAALQRYIVRHAPPATRIGLESVVIRARFSEGPAPDAWMVPSMSQT